MGDYVPFYFAPRSPMLYAIDRGAVAGYQGGQAPIIYLCSTVEAVVEKGLEWVFTEGHAEMAYTDFFNDVADLDKVDWKLMREKYWNDTDEDGDQNEGGRPSSLFVLFSLGICSHMSEYQTMPYSKRRQQSSKRLHINLNSESKPVGTIE